MMAKTSFHALFFAERATVPIVNPPARLSMQYPAKRAQPRRIPTAASDGNGIVVVTGARHSILGNSIYANTSNGQGPGFGLGIDLGFDGVTLNDLGDADTGVNNLQNFPVFTSVANGGGMKTITGRLNSSASTSYRIEFFANGTIDAT